MKSTIKLVLAFILANIQYPIRAQVATAGIDVEDLRTVEARGLDFSITLDKSDWLYTVGEPTEFTIKLFVDGKPIEAANLSYTIGPEKMPPVKRGTIAITDGYAKLSGGTMHEAGFLRCEVSANINGKVQKAAATAAFDPEKIKPTATMPADFEQYWAAAINDARSIPLDYKLTPIPKKSNDLVDVYQAEYHFLNNGIQKFYGVLSVPKKEGKYPAIIRFPGAGYAPLGGDQTTAAKGFITLDIYIHGRPVTMDRSYYEDLQHNELKEYRTQGITNKDSYYYKNVILGCVRSVDLIYSLPQFDRKNIGGWGSSQGGALSIITTSLENRINYLVALCPAMCDHTGYLSNRAGGWPHVFAKPAFYQDHKDQIMNTVSYYDVVNFARRLRVPGFFSWGFNDRVTPPTSIYAAYNTIQSPKQVSIIRDGEHKIYPEQKKVTYAWLIEKLKQQATDN
ncbi:acetylxylan esterase [Sphingobacterium sp. SGG-5]|uniref:acetylxylan esterase n=1 Tax=Sphingobacterium sp. SGG-5 TaxID=2710881 RepID=UPI0013EB1388|nr:acetylxylan esterase [Sphingobacterium sp. SGG-5]NGM63297.1 acetylxylan esterase [Sphingobacterium sp. SGG-5]